ncbi:transcription antitermination factor NusB [Tunicatimonas pelagia]|uniref:transcription antitermination factor NusB n=1 Tax=Tunicatimonas pelagia TaxID=931531 RepID=UPI0026660528|nr:transcription antitermination factor NusB [Tunicatimonas pelagia]WKN45553.1 transcription antitermination factor NusB [Tunicatimonas pelagia]
MLNRRLLRIKAMQHIYAYQQCQQANRALAFDYVRAAFEPDLNAMELPDPEQLAQDRRMAEEILTARLEGNLGPTKSSETAQRVAKEALERYDTQTQKDRAFLKNQMLARVESMSDHYKLSLLLLVAVADESHREIQKKPRSAESVLPEKAVSTRFYLNPVVQAIRDNQALQQEAANRNWSWEEQQGAIRQLYRNTIKEDEAFLTYQHATDTTLEEDVTVVRQVFNEHLLKSEVVNNFFEDLDISWEENQKVIRSLVNRSLKSIVEHPAEGIEIATLTPNWEDDKAFFEKLYSLTVRNDAEYEQIIAEKSKNWAIDRIASMDQVILKMAIAEMINFSSIPVKVTINEYVDVSKQYSTQKSKQFINGLLDVIAQSLQERSLIRKSGRGLIDNR